MCYAPQINAKELDEENELDSREKIIQTTLTEPIKNFITISNKKKSYY